MIPTASFHRLRFALALAVALFASCRGGNPDEQVTTTSGDLVTSADVLGFEASSSWSAPAGVALGQSSVHTQGAHSLSVRPAGYVPINSVPLPPPIAVGSTLSVDLLLPTAQANPFWFGALQVFFNCPSCNVYNAYVGQVELTGLPTNVFETLTLKVPAALATALHRDATDVTVTIVLNVPSNATGTYLLDNLVLSAAVPLCNGSNAGARCDDGNACTTGDVCAGSVCKGTAIPNCSFDAPSNTATISVNRPIVLTAYRPACTSPGNSVELPSTSPLAIPASLSVTAPGAISVDLALSGTFAPLAHCTYTASSGSGTRQAPLVSCSNGMVAGQLAEQVSAFTLTVLSAAGVSATGDGVCTHSAAKVTLPLGSDDLPRLAEPFSPAETTAMRNSFSWANTHDLAELDAQGRPLLYYAAVYIENHLQISYLDRLQIHHDFLPIFEGLERWRGQVGVFAQRGDGRGYYRFAILTGSLFNQLRHGALDGKVAFAAINLRAPPPAFTNPDGQTLSYRALANIGFRYRGIDPAVAAQQPPLAPIQCSDNLLGLAEGLIVDIGGGVHDLASGIAHFIGNLLGDIPGKRHAFVTLRAMSTDPTFDDASGPPPISAATPTTGFLHDTGFKPTTMTQAWGFRQGLPIMLEGVEVQARGISLPSFDSGTLDSQGLVGGLEFVVDVDTMVCFKMSNAAADIHDVLDTVVLCDSRGYSLRDSAVDAGLSFNVKDERLNVLAQMTDGRNFMKQVAGMTVGQAQILTGPYADVLPNAITPCFASVLQSQLPVATFLALYGSLLDLTLAPLAIPFGECIYNIDMAVPSKEGFARSRGGVSHEFGHWANCSMLARGAQSPTPRRS